MGTNEIPKAGDGGMRDAGDSNVGRLRDESQAGSRDTSTSTSSVDAARTACEAKCGPMNTWMSMNENPQGFKKATDDLAKQTPEQIRATIANNEVQVKAVQALTDGLKARIEAVRQAQVAQEKLHMQQRGQ